MYGTDTDSETFADIAAININIPQNRIDLKNILLSLKWEIINGGIRLTPYLIFSYRQCYVPSLKHPLRLWYDDGYIFYEYSTEKNKIPFAFEDDTIPDHIIDIICAIAEHHQSNTGY